MKKVQLHLLDCFYFVRLGIPSAAACRISSILKRKLPHTNTLSRSANTEYEPETALFFQVEKGKCFLDVGANVGIYTKQLALRGVPVYAFEPSPKTFEILRQNTRGLPNVKVFSYALGDKNAEISFYVHEQSNSGYDGLYNEQQLVSTVYGNKDVKKIKVRVRTLDSFHFKNVGLIKIDTEGYEYPILTGAIQTLKKQKPKLIIEIHEPIWKNDILIMNLLRKIGYKNLTRVWWSSHKKYHIIGEDEGKVQQ